MARSKASNISKPKKQGVSDPGGASRGAMSHLTDTGSGDMAASVGSEDQRIGESFPGMGSETRAHMGGNMDGYHPNS